MAKKNKKKKHIPRKKEEINEQNEQNESTADAPDRLSETNNSENENSKKVNKKVHKYQLPRNSKAAIALVFIGLAALIFIGYFLFTKLLRPQYLAELLPEKNTVALVEFTFDQTQWNDLKEALKPYPLYDLQKAKAFFEQLSSLQLASDIQPWLGRRAGIAILQMESSGTLERFYIAESVDHQKTIVALAGSDAKPSSEYQKFPLYQSPKNNGWFTFINNSLVMARNQEVLEDFLDSVSAPKLYTSDTYRKVANNIPVNGAVFAYVNLEKTWPQLTQIQGLTNLGTAQWKTFMPFLQLFKAVGISAKIEKGRIITQIFTSIDKQKIDGKGFIEYPDKYQGNMLALANDGTLFFMGGHDLTRELSRLETVFQSGISSSALTFEGLLEGQKERYFGKDVSLKDDLYPVLSEEYLVTMEGTLQKPIFNFFLKLDPKNKDKFDKLLTAFIKTDGIFSPQIKEVTLPDGTKGQEVVAVGQVIRRSDESYNNDTITNLQIGEDGMAAYMAFVNNNVLISTDKNSLKKIIDRAEGNTSQNLTDEASFGHNLQLVMKTADEVTGLKAQSLLNFIPHPEMIAGYLEPFENILVGKNYFEDGISEIYLISLK